MRQKRQTKPSLLPLRLCAADGDMYDEHGIRDILYIAKAPFTSNLNLTQKEPQKALFFMSETVLQDMMKNRDDLNIPCWTGFATPSVTFPIQSKTLRSQLPLS
ncbi:MAG: hypothetical protein ABFS56_06305 [Pseudomonadota bacterium]